MAEKLSNTISVIGIDIGKNSFHVVGHDRRGAIVLRQKWSRRQLEGHPTRTLTRSVLHEPYTSKKS